MFVNALYIENCTMKVDNLFKDLENNMEKAMIHLAKAASTSMSEAINAPTKIDAESLNDTPIPHKNLEKYDHSLEVNRDWQNPTKS